MARDQAAGNAIGHGVPASGGSIPRSKPEGALMKDADEIAPVPSRGKPPSGDTPGATDPASSRNRDMSYLLLPTAPGTPGAARG
jgi:cytochrome o ubiquinol oxidase subunit 2